MLDAHFICYRTVTIRPNEVEKYLKIQLPLCINFLVFYLFISVFLATGHPYQEQLRLDQLRVSYLSAPHIPLALALVQLRLEVLDEVVDVVEAGVVSARGVTERLELFES